MAKTPAKMPPKATQDIGYPINWMTIGRFGDFIKPLHGIAGLLELERMVDTDETVGAVMFTIVMMVCQVGFKHQACQHGAPVADNAKADKAAAFADTLLVDMDVDWYEHLEEAMTMVWAGFAPCEITLRQRSYANGSRFNDGLYGLKSLDLRDQASIVQFVYDPVTFEMTGMRQSLGRDTIPAWKICNYRTSSVLKRPYGRSLFANAHRVWRLKTKIQDAEAIGIERDMAGLPTLRVPSVVMDESNERDEDGVYTPTALKAQAQIQAAIDAVTKMRFNETGGLVLPSDPWAAADDDITSNLPQWDFKLTTTSGQRAIDPRTPARDHDRAIARAVMMQFLHLGDRSSGSYGLSDDQSSMAIKALMALAWKVARTFSKSVLPLVWEANGMDRQYLPQLQPQELSKEALAAIGQYLTGLSKVMPMIDGDPQARSQALARAGIDSDPQKQHGSLMPQAPDPADDPNPADPGPAAGAT